MRTILTPDAAAMGRWVADQAANDLRQAIASGLLAPDHQQFGAIKLTAAARPVLKGEVSVRLRPAAQRKAEKKKSKTAKIAAESLDADATDRFERLREWRREAAKERGMPPYVIFHDSTLMAVAQRAPQNTEELSGISGIGEKKLADWGDALIAAIASPA